jgi:excisionase family DNA binding protein
MFDSKKSPSGAGTPERQTGAGIGLDRVIQVSNHVSDAPRSSIVQQNPVNVNHFDKEIFTISELSGFLKLSKSMLYQLLRRGDLKASKVGKKWLVRRSDVDVFVGSREYIPPRRFDFRL